MAVPSHPWASIIVPIKDEGDNLVPLIEGLLPVMSSHAASQPRPFEIIFVDDGSSDGSSEVLDRLGAQHSQIRVFHLDRNYGMTCALEAGFARSSGELIIQIDGVNPCISSSEGKNRSISSNTSEGSTMATRGLNRRGKKEIEAIRYGSDYAPAFMLAWENFP
ncbi:MAG TPA: glycosyltransferase [Nitrospiraceae bacterium]|nr:glycosyltransferase [Nitrospiraceae bacterium]